MRRFFCLSALGFALAFLSPGQMNRAFAEEDLPRLLPEPGVSAHIERREEGYVLIQPDGSKLVLLDSDWLTGLDGPVGFDTADYDFDGYTDLALRAREAGSLPNLKTPIYGQDEIEMDYPPRLPDSLIDP